MATGAFVASTAYLYESVSDANASWRRGTSAAGQRCLREGLRRELGGSGARLVSFGKVAFPRLAERTVLYRAVVVQQGVRVVLDLLALQRTRAQTSIVVGSALAPPPRDVELRLGRLVAGRMERALRGS
jgi:hypothetical protein